MGIDEGGGAVNERLSNVTTDELAEELVERLKRIKEAVSEASGAGGTKIGSDAMSVRAINCLDAAQITTAEQLASMKRTQLKKLRGFGKTCEREVDQYLARLGLRLREEDPPFRPRPQAESPNSSSTTHQTPPSPDPRTRPAA